MVESLRHGALACLTALVLAAWLLGGCASGPRAEAVVSLQEINCQSCGEMSVKTLERMDGVYEASFDRKNVELTVDYDPNRVAPEQLVAAVGDLGFEAVAGAGQGKYSAHVEFPAGLDVAWLTRSGEAVDLEAHRVPGKVTVFDFYADWCGPCREVDRDMVVLLGERDDVALRKLNVVDWDTALARQYLGDVVALPYVVVYGKDGERVETISGLDLAALRAAIEAGGAR